MHESERSIVNRDKKDLMLAHIAFGLWVLMVAVVAVVYS